MAPIYTASAPAFIAAIPLNPSFLQVQEFQLSFSYVDIFCFLQ
jgi:hypothetical protein